MNRYIMNIENNYEMHSSGRNEGPMVDALDESSKSSSCDDGEKCNEQMGDHLVENEETNRFLYKMTAVLRY